MICKRVKIYAREKKCDHIMERKAWYVCVYMCLCTNIHLYMHRIWNDVRTLEPCCLSLNFISALTSSVTLPYLYNGDKELSDLR